MAREKVTITVDRTKLAEARQALGARSASEAVDLALADVLRRARLRADVEAYARVPQDEDEQPLAEVPVDWSDLVDDTDWESLWSEE